MLVCNETTINIIMRCASAKREPFFLGFPRKKKLFKADRARVGCLVLSFSVRAGLNEGKQKTKQNEQTFVLRKKQQVES